MFFININCVIFIDVFICDDVSIVVSVCINIFYK